ncbi:MAG: 30S ribosomal protein S20 [Alphaproteobacteria bacterium MarineAlpha2_Bin1]|nr:MAG: 30S ribosomal protein S20 [Alphaproteobacteria bacterium MarineAlpha2_Bin1]
MANHKSALKRIRSNKKKTLTRGSRITFLRTSIKSVETALENKDQTAAKEAFKSAESQIMKGVSKGVIKKNTASRKISRLSNRIKALSL